ncbi:SDR family NAD(P)-dependent oxidoreductase [Limosilactobacillus kribbianus]|uniref:SDR family NAD(P)-dependent oxidoreductase n=1 Tax=Limosilactobacillus kribbianus TaxID=2982695 RepID=UPI00226449BC|nr:SDR family oxidoreductase [Limosilactobacillus kribbianus]
MGMLDQKVAIITGATSGMGKTTAELFAREGAQVIIADINDDHGGEVVENIQAAGGQAQYQHLDVRNMESWAKLVRSLERVDVLVNNAGIAPLTTKTLDEWNNVMAINLTGPMLGIEAVLPLMKKQKSGSIINISSGAGATGCQYTAYSTSKWGLRGLTRSYALRLGDDNIRVNAILPGCVKTPMAPDDFIKQVEPALPGKRAAQPIEIAHASLFLASDLSSYVNGQDLTVDNGLNNLGVYEGFTRAMPDYMKGDLD